ncbi:MAG: EF-hand domain-containing protein [Verrucomicrobia bacterium]|nr:EF-hand domain-containing protein [Verrucomicrobiota bacterium]
MRFAPRSSSLGVLVLGLTFAVHVNAADVSALNSQSWAPSKTDAPRPALRGDKALGPYSVFDTNHDGSLSALEISAAAEVLRKLDKNHDGALTADELRPARPPRPPHGGYGEPPPPLDEPL